MFSISTRGRYAARAMMELALHDSGSPVQLAEISAVQGISLKYLSRIMSSLISAGLASSQRGKNGGYVLGKPAERIRILDVLQAVEGPVEPAPCTGRREKCGRTEGCVTRVVWLKVADSLTTVLAGITLKELAGQVQARRRGREESDYSI
jgi:Rrf2 family protein